jgi:hypothetical protein
VNLFRAIKTNYINYIYKSEAKRKFGCFNDFEISEPESAAGLYPEDQSGEDEALLLVDRGRSATVADTEPTIDEIYRYMNYPR